MDVLKCTIYEPTVIHAKAAKSKLENDILELIKNFEGSVHLGIIEIIIENERVNEFATFHVKKVKIKTQL